MGKRVNVAAWSITDDLDDILFAAFVDFVRGFAAHPRRAVEGPCRYRHVW